MKSFTVCIDWGEREFQALVGQISYKTPFKEVLAAGGWGQGEKDKEDWAGGPGCENLLAASAEKQEESCYLRATALHNCSGATR
jgi:hypothetical protein